MSICQMGSFGILPLHLYGSQSLRVCVRCPMLSKFRNSKLDVGLVSIEWKKMILNK